MFNFLKRQPPANQLLIQELERFSENYQGPNVFDGIVAKIATKEILDTVKRDSGFSEDTISKGGWSARDAACLLISEFALSALQSGHLHIYRGTLNDQGHAYERLYKACLGSLLKSGRYSEEDAAEQVIELKNLIAEIG